MTNIPEFPLIPRAPMLVTERLELWLPLADDMHAMLAIVSDSETGRYLGPAQDAALSCGKTMRNAGSWFLYGYGIFSVRERGREETIGCCGIFHSWRGLGEDFDDKPEGGWIIARQHTGKGYASEAMHAALAWFDARFGPREVVCMIAPDNAASIALSDKLGFVSMRDAQFDGDETDEPVRLFKRPARGGAE